MMQHSGPEKTASVEFLYLSFANGGFQDLSILLAADTRSLMTFLNA
jgi:hypothetical protein